jgi:uncharacterized protein YrzB (UPF0473 family)
MSEEKQGILRKVYGDDIILFDEQNESTVYQLLAELTHGDQPYAVLQSEELKKDDEFAFFRIVEGEPGQYELETIEDDEEWETISELYDEMMFPVKEDL